MVARALERASAGQDALVDEVLKVARGRRAGGPCDRNVVLGAQAAFETLDPFAEDSGESFLLPLIELILDLVVELGFADQKVNHALCRFLRAQYDVGKIPEPCRDFVVPAAAV